MRALFRCDGAPVPEAVIGDAALVQKTIDFRSPSANLNLRIQNLWNVVLDEVDGRAADLVRIAAYVYAADQEISRGGPADIYGDSWYREMNLAIPVADLAFWSDDTVRAWLEETLLFLTRDTWRFWFSQVREGRGQLRMALGERQLRLDPECVVLFSGGADSLCAAVESIVNERVRPLLVSHRSSPPLDSRQQRLVERLSELAPSHRPAHVGFWVHRMGSDPSDASQRSRGFLFASLGAALAGQLGISRVVLPDNGVISVNLPINAQVVGALASRSTHPKFIWLFNHLVEPMFGTQVRIENPFALRTRKEVLSILGAAGWVDLLQQTSSCSHPRGRTKAQPHCGDCSQCVDRRFGALAAGLGAYDPATGYERDIFTHALPEGEPRTISESYVRLARWLRKQEPEQLFMNVRELDDVIVPDEQDVASVSRSYAAMFRRHGDAVVDVLGRLIVQHHAALAAEELPPTCLLRLAQSGQSIPSRDPRTETPTEQPGNLFRAEGRLRHIRFEGHETWIEDTVGTRQLARLLGEPGREFDVMDLVERRSSMRGKALSREDEEQLKGGDASHEVLDDEAMVSYRARLRELSAEREAAERDEDEIALDRIQRDYEQIESALTAAEGPGGRRRSFTGDREKARQAVRRTINLVRKTISEVHPSLGRHLENAVTTGWFCVYRPENPVVWTM